MIYIYSHDLTFSERILNSIKPQAGEIFTDEARLNAALTGALPDAIVFDFRSGANPYGLAERLYLEAPAIAQVAVLPASNFNNEILADREFFWPVEPSEIALALAEIADDRKIIASCGLVGRSSELAIAGRTALQVAPTDINVLITGPSGAGKEMIARAINSASSHPNGPFIPVNVAALAPGIIESELFGHEKGSFTGASARRQGVFEQAGGGILFLDEIGEIPPEIQAKLLRVLEQRTFTRVGGNVPISANFRLIAATNRDLSLDVSQGRFREDLYYRLRVVSIDLAPLASRKADISPLVYHFLKIRGRELGTEKLSIEPSALKLFYQYHWPGNVRELKNVIDSFSVTSSTGQIRASDFERYMREQGPRSSLLPVVSGRTSETSEHQLIMQAVMLLTGEVSSLKHLIERELERSRMPHAEGPIVDLDRKPSVNIEDAERDLVMRALNQAGGNRKKAADLLGIGERTLYRKLDKYGLK